MPKQIAGVFSILIIVAVLVFVAELARSHAICSGHVPLMLNYAIESKLFFAIYKKPTTAETIKK